MLVTELAATKPDRTWAAYGEVRALGIAAIARQDKSLEYLLTVKLASVYY